MDEADLVNANGTSDNRGGGGAGGHGSGGVGGGSGQPGLVVLTMIAPSVRVGHDPIWFGVTL